MTQPGEVFDFYYDYFYLAVRNFINKHLNGQPELADDLAQETFLRLYKHADRYAWTDYKTLLYRIARNLIADHYRRVKVVAFESLDTITESGWEPFRTEGEPEAALDVVEHQEKMAALNAAIAKLRPQDQLYLELYIGYNNRPGFNELVQRELGWNPKTAKSRKYKIIARLQKMLIAQGIALD